MARWPDRAASLTRVPSKAARGIRIFEAVTMIYVALPFLIFAAGWLRPWIALPVAALVAVAVWSASVDRDAPAEGDPFASPSARQVAALAVLGLVVFVLVVYSGAGGYAFQHKDYARHNAFLADSA